MTAVAREAIRRLRGPPSLGASPIAFIDHIQRAPKHPSGERTQAVHAQPQNPLTLTAAATTSAPILNPSHFPSFLLQTNISVSLKVESSTLRMLQMLRLQQQQQQQQQQQDHQQLPLGTRGWVVMPPESSSSSSSGSIISISTSSRLVEFVFHHFLNQSSSPHASFLPSSNNASQVYLHLKQAAINKDAYLSWMHAQSPFFTSSVEAPRLNYYCWNRNPSSRYPKRANNGARPKCRVMRKLRKRLRTGR
ncbi:hypothetical protein ACSSS7_003161 [Eimeria intestinalis]